MSKKKTPERPKKTKVRLKLTEEQKKDLVDAFGPTFLSRLKHIDVEKIEGFLKAELHAN